MATRYSNFRITIENGLIDGTIEFYNYYISVLQQRRNFTFHIKIDRCIHQARSTKSCTDLQWDTIYNKKADKIHELTRKVVKNIMMLGNTDIRKCKIKIYHTSQTKKTISGKNIKVLAKKASDAIQAMIVLKKKSQLV